MIVFPMAGESRRFKEAGFERPKFMLEAHGRPLFDYSVGGFSGYFQRETLLFVIRNVGGGVDDFVRARCAALGLNTGDYLIAELDAPTSGQAETVAEGLRRAEAAAETSISIFNIDTRRPNFRHPEAARSEKVDGYLEVFRGEGDHWSFVRPADPGVDWGRALEVSEKRRISDLCCTGLYQFRRCGDFLDAYAETLTTPAADLDGGERYVAPLYDRLIGRGKSIYFNLIDSAQVDFYGVPAEYDAFKRRVPPPDVT